jgi:hypothetical protein
MQTEMNTEHYQNFTCAIYARVYEVIEMGDLDWLKARFDVMQRWIKVDKVYLETHRDTLVVDEDTLLRVKQFFHERGVSTSGGITITVNERNRFETYCYTNPQHRQMLKEVVTYTARHFDEVLLDDFFFTNCKCESCIQAKAGRSWTRFRLDLMDEAACTLVLQPARLANPKVSVVIKYPNWYEHFQGLGFNLETEPGLFDQLYTGTETRDPRIGNQHLQQYHGYSIFRYFENLKPGGNGGGWVDTGGMFTLDRYAEQLWLTLFAKAPEITLFDFRQLQRPIEPSLRAAWQGSGTSFDFDRMIAPVARPDGTWPEETTVALAAGYALELVDPLLGELGQPVGLKCYRPHHSAGEDYLPSFLGMVGIPIDLAPEFPHEARTAFLAENAAHDPQIVAKIERQLRDGKTVVITSGLLRRLQDRGLRDIVELEVSDRKALVQDFLIGWFGLSHIPEPILIPQITYLTNDSWEEVSAKAGFNGYPLLHSAKYAGGTLYVLTIPENFSDLYRLPREVLRRIRTALLDEFYVQVDSPGLVSLFVYDNHTFIIESFRDEPVDVGIILEHGLSAPLDLISGETLPGEPVLDWCGQPVGKMGFPAAIKPHSYRLFRCHPSSD